MIKISIIKESIKLDFFSNPIILILLILIIALITSFNKGKWNALKLKIDTITNYLEYFGWIGLLAMIFMLAISYFWPAYFPVTLLFFIIGVFLFFPMKFIYVLVGGSNSLRSFFMLFLLTQFLFSFFYWTQFNLIMPDQIMYSQILLNTFHIALIQESSPAFGNYIDSIENGSANIGFFIILNVQIFISWLYLGVLIASLYNKITNR